DVGQRGIGVVVGMVLLADEEPHERTALAAIVVADRAPENRVARLQRVEDTPLRDRAVDLDQNLARDPGEVAQMGGEDDPDHGSVCTSTESTAGRSRTTASHVSPPSADA